MLYLIIMHWSNTLFYGPLMWVWFLVSNTLVHVLKGSTLLTGYTKQIIMSSYNKILQWKQFIGAFDREYVTAYDTVESCCDSTLFLRCDVPPSPTTLFCRHVFRELQLWQYSSLYLEYLLKCHSNQV